MNNTSNDHYKFGVFYYNKDDRSPFVKKKYGLGITMNWASPWAWLIAVAIVSAIVYYML